MPEFKTIPITLQCDQSHSTCHIDVTYQKVNRSGGMPSGGKLVQFDCPNDSQCPTDQCPVYSKQFLTIDW